MQSGGDAGALESALQRAHRFLRANSQAYNLAYASAKIVTTGRRGEPLAADEFAQGLELTERLLSALAREAARNAADLLIVIIPSWNELMDLGAEDDPPRQREMISQVAAAQGNVYVLDLTEEIQKLDARGLYGQIDKHLNSLGAYTAARSIYEWIARAWPNGPRAAALAPPFEDDDWGITQPDCGLVDGYKQRLLEG